MRRHLIGAALFAAMTLAIVPSRVDAQDSSHTIEFVKRSLIEYSIVADLDLDNSDAQVIAGSTAWSLIQAYYADGLIDDAYYDGLLQQLLTANGFKAALLSLDNGDDFLYVPLTPQSTLADFLSSTKLIVQVFTPGPEPDPNPDPKYLVGFEVGGEFTFCTGCTAEEANLGCYPCNTNYGYPSSPYDSRPLSARATNTTLPGWNY